MEALPDPTRRRRPFPPRATAAQLPLLFLLAFVALASAEDEGSAQSPEPAGPPSSELDFETQVRPLLQGYCFRCHGEKEQRGDIRLDVLDPDMVDGPDAAVWHTALDMVNGGEMPPSKEKQPTDEERRLLVSWLTVSLDEAAALHKGASATVLRRLNKAQYTHSLQDLLGVQIDFGDVLPDDGKSEMGFTNNGEVLQASPLHLDYYQAIARHGLAQAIVVGDEPEVSRYRVTFGKGIGRGLAAGHTGGYQSVPLNTDDFVVEILDRRGDPVIGVDQVEQETLDSIRRKISVGLRGSSQERFRIVEEGMLLYSALPHRERVPQAWQGPSPNLKLELQRCFPQEGDFVMRVSASRGYLIPAPEQLLVGLENPAARATIDKAADQPEASADAQVLAASASDQHQNLVEEGPDLVPQDPTAPSSARVALQVSETGYYQIDLVHPVVPRDAMPSVRLSLGSSNLDMRLEPTAEEQALGRMVTPLGAVFLRAGRHHLKVGGPFFVGFSHIVAAPLSGEHPLVLRLSAATDELEAALEGKLPALRALIGTRTDDGMDYKTFDAPTEVAAPLGRPETYTFRGRLENLPIPEPDSGDTEILSGIMVLGLWNDHLVKSADQTGPPLLVHSIEFEAPYHAVWPPESHTDIFFASPHREGQNADELLYTAEVLARFLKRAFRRSIDQDELARYIDFWRDVKDDFEHYEEGVAEVLVAALCSPNFLYLAEPLATDAPGVLYEEALANRLAYFLWNSPPDETLRSLARAGRLRQELPAQVDRLLDDPRSGRFVRAFAREWLRLDRLGDILVDVDTHPAFTRFVKRDMEEETYHFVQEVLTRDLSLFTLVDSDFAMLNQNLAEFYGVEGVRGNRFRPVPVTPEQGRGGLLSQGAFLTGHSDGSQPHPIKRAVWVKEKILGDPPPPPPPNVPELDPDTPGFEELTLKEQLELHRQKPSCVDCHAGLDPYGVVFEGYNAVGLQQDERMGKPVDAASVLPDGTVVEGVAELKAYIRTQVPDAFVNSLIKHLFAYALGRDVHFSDEEELALILEKVKSEGYSMRSVIESIVTGPSFTRFNP